MCSNGATTQITNVFNTDGYEIYGLTTFPYSNSNSLILGLGYDLVTTEFSLLSINLSNGNIHSMGLFSGFKFCFHFCFFQKTYIPRPYLLFENINRSSKMQFKGLATGQNGEILTTIVWHDTGEKTGSLGVCKW